MYGFMLNVQKANNLILNNIGRSHVQNPVTPGLRPGYDLPAIETCWNDGPIVERSHDWWQRSYDWWQRSWVITRGKSVATRSMFMFKT